MPGGSSAELHGGRGELRRSTVYLGGWQVPRPGAVCGSMHTALTRDAKDYAGHSLDAATKTLGWWESSTYTRYIRTLQAVLQGVAKAVDSQ